MKILVINLESQKERLEFQRHQLERLDLAFEKLSAIEADHLSLQIINSQKHQWERPLRDSEIACLASHQAAWRKSLDLGEPILVLEDDALLSHHTPDILAKLENQTGLDHVTLEVRGRKKILGNSPVSLDNHHVRTRLYQDRTGAAAYVIWPSGAEKLLARSRSRAGLADAIIAAAYELSSWQIEPAAAVQLDQCEHYKISQPLITHTTIGTKNHEKPSSKNMWMALNFKFKRIYSQLRMGLRQLSTITIARRRFARVEISNFQVHITANKSK